eukprot:TRINITY_DN6131_c0_g1_i1.p3 TRINITY_DN6131_c0_g1~~TRINITY_DN6131_c0_g1_i1.p3  ORF type:complete len:183 (-),score=21.68 TRINITY_DN6131_c0_g1_i1:733-1281(-)
MIRRPPRSTHCISSAASDVYKRQVKSELYGRQDNAFVPLICGEQCTGKTTFTRSILPPPLRIYYSEEPIGKYGKEITPPRGYIMVHGTDMECPILYEAKCYKEMYGKRKKGTRIPSVIYTTSWDQQECCEPFIFFEITRSIDNESPVNYEQLYAQIIQKLKDEQFFFKEQIRLYKVHSLIYS